MRNMNKRGMDVTYYTVIFLVLNLIFISSMLYFVYSSKNNRLTYEQLYAKEIALFLDIAKPGMEILLNFEKGFEISKENENDEKLVEINPQTNEIKVKLGKEGGYLIKYFTTNKVTVTESAQEKKILIKVEKNEK